MIYRRLNDAICQIAPFFYKFRQGKAAIISLTMQVFVELAIAENFCMDFTLLYCAKAAVKNPCGVFRIAVASALGACFAVVFPLFALSGAWAQVIKILAGGALCLIAGKFNSVKGYLKFTTVFLIASFALGGLLIGIFSLADVAYDEGGGVILSSVPVGIPLFFALVFVVAVRRIARKMIANHAKIEVNLRIFVGEKCVSAVGFYDSGNKVYDFGQPVSVVPRFVAEQLVEVEGIKTFTKIHTVAGSRKIAVFTADKIEIDEGEKTRTLKKVRLGVAPNAIAQAVLHPDLAEGI